MSEKRFSRAQSYDAWACREAKLDDLDLAFFANYRSKVVDQEIIKNNHRSTEDQLASLRFYDLKYNCPTYAGVLAFENNPRYFLPGAYVQFLLFPTEDRSQRPIDQEEIGGNLWQIINKLELRSTSHITNRLEEKTAFQEKLVANYPYIAIREFLYNAVMHRDYQSATPTHFYWYSDRIEIQNPAGLVGTLNKEEAISKCYLRNPVISEVIKGYGFVNKYGYGIYRAQKMLKDNGNPPAEIEADQYSFKVTIRARG